MEARGRAEAAGQAEIRLLGASAASTWAALAVEAGYYDHAHLARELCVTVLNYTVVNSMLSLGPDGFPADAFFHDDSVPFTLTASLLSGESTLTGFLNLRHITTGTAP